MTNISDEIICGVTKTLEGEYNEQNKKHSKAKLKTIIVNILFIIFETLKARC